MTEQLFVATAPVFEVRGQVEGELARDLVRLEVGEATGGLKTLSARFLAFGPGDGRRGEEIRYLGGTLDFGRELAVTLGPAGESEIVFRGRVSALEAGFAEGREPEVVVFAEDRLMDLRMTRRTRTWERTSDAEIADEIAGLHGLESNADADGPRYDVVQQWNMSDLAFLRERARLIRAEIWLDGQTLCFKSRERRGGPEITLVQGREILALEVRADLAHQRTAVRVSGYDAAGRAGVDEEAGGDVVEAEVSAGRSGPEILERAFGERVSYRVREAPLGEREARGWARGEMLRRGRAFVRARGVTHGTPAMVVGSRLTLERVGGPFAGGGYYVTRVRHTYDPEEGHRTHFEAERATLEEAT